MQSFDDIQLEKPRPLVEVEAGCPLPTVFTLQMLGIEMILLVPAYVRAEIYYIDVLAMTNLPPTRQLAFGEVSVN